MSPLFSAIFLLGLCVANAVNFTTVYQLDKFDFIWPSGADTSIGQMKQNFNPGDVYLRYMAVFGERLLLSLDKNSGIPATLVWLPTSGTSTAPPKLAPFPSLDLHKKDNCDSIQWARGMEIDPDGRLWVVDDGSRNCPSKIWIFNLLNNDTTERVHQFPDTVVSHSFDKRWLHDIVLDKTTDDYLAYITDSYSEHIIVYNRKLDKSWSVKTPRRQWNSLALSPNTEARQLYLARWNSIELYSVSVSELKNEGGSAAAVKLIGSWTGEPYRMLIDSANVLYAAFKYQNYLSKWNISEPFREQRFHEVGELGSSWRPLFVFALDTNGNLWVTERNQTGDWTKPRHKLLKAAVGVRSYQFSTSTVSITTRRPLQETTEQQQKTTASSTSSSRFESSPSPSLKTRKTQSTWSPLYKSESTEPFSSGDPTARPESNLPPITDRSTTMTTPPAQGTTSVTTSSRIPVPETTKSIPISQQISTQHSSALPLKTLSTTDVNEETTEVVKSTLTPTRKTGTPQPALESNETSGDFPGLAEDYRKSQYLVTVLTWLLVCCFISLILSGTVIVWLTLKMRRMQTSLRQISVDNRAEMSVFPEDPIYDDVGPENSNTAPSEEATPENPDESLYAEVLPEPLASADHEYASARTPSPEPYEEPLRLGNTNAGIPSEPVYDEVGKTEPENIYDDVGPSGPSSGPSRNENSGRKPTESVQYLEVLPKSG